MRWSRARRSVRLGSALLDITDHFSVAYVLLLGNFIELVMFNLDFGWARFEQVGRRVSELV